MKIQFTPTKYSIFIKNSKCTTGYAQSKALSGML